jgi:hypothetical protein
MPFVPAPNIVSVEVRATNDAQHIENRFNVNANAAVTPTIVDDICNLVSVWAQAEYFPLLPSAVELTEVFAKDLTTITGAQHTIVPSGTVVGGQAAAPAPNEVSFCVSLRTGNAGRSARGRFFVLAIPKDLITANTISPTLRGQLVAAGQSLISALSGGGYALTIVSYVSEKVPRPGGPVYFDVTTAIATDGLVDSQRRRKPGNGS